MVKKLSVLALTAMLALPGGAMAGGSPADLEAKIDQLTQELAKLKKEMAQIKSDSEDVAIELEERSEAWDLASRIQFSGDFRSRIDYVTADTTQHWTALELGHGIADWMTVGNVMNRWEAANPGSMFFTAPAPSVAATNFGGVYFTQRGTAESTGFIDINNDGTHDANEISISSNEITALNNVFNSATVQGLLGLIGGNRIDGSDNNGGTTTFTNLQNLTGFMKTLTAAQRQAIFTEMGYSPAAANEYDNDHLWTNRFRMNMRVKATENVEFKGRLAMYKAWGMQNNPVDYQANAGMGGGPFMLNSALTGFDGGTTRQPADNILRVDRAFMNWNNVAGLPMWFSIGRRPTTDGPPAHLRMGADEKMATPVAYMDWPFDGLTIGYAHSKLFGMNWPGRIRFCYGRGFESGPTEDSSNSGINDVDFAGFNWDVYNKGDRFFNVQSFGAFNVFNVPDGVTFPNPVEYWMWTIDPSFYVPTDPSKNLILDRANLGNLFHTDAVYMSKVGNLDYFVSAGWSRTQAEGMDELGTSLLGSFYDNPSDKDGYSFYIGGRYDIPDQPFKVGLEYNYGTKNWIGLTPGNDDLYASKLATRGHVFEAYTIWDIPAGEKLSKFAKAFIRLGYQHYSYDYTGSGFWLGEPLDIDQLGNEPLNAQFYTPVKDMDQVYLSMEAWF